MSGLAEQGIHTFLEPARGLHALSRLVAYGAALARAPRPATWSLPPFDWPAFVPESAPVVIPEHRCHAILRAAGLPAAAGELAGDEDAAVRAAEAVGLPVVLKGISPTVTHRAAAGLVAIDLRSADEVREAFRRLQARAGEVGVALDGVLVQAMHRGGVELLVSAFRDPLFGTMVSVGAGGGLTELIDDVATERAPVDRSRAAAMMERLRITRRAVDGRVSLAQNAPAEFIARFSELAATAPWNRFVFEVNPIKWTREGVVAVDGAADPGGDLVASLKFRRAPPAAARTRTPTPATAWRARSPPRQPAGARSRSGRGRGSTARRPTSTATGARPSRSAARGSA